MGKILPPLIIDDFSRGMTNDLRIGDTRYAKLIKNFDAHTYKGRLVPFRNSESGNSVGDTDRIRNFLIALRTGTGADAANAFQNSIFGLGRVSGASERAEVQYKDLYTGQANDLDDGDWTNTGSHQSGAGTATDYDLFVWYKKANSGATLKGLIFGARDGTNFWAYDPTTTAAFADSNESVTYTDVAQGLVHPADDILYIPYTNATGTAGAFIASKNATAAMNLTALTLPREFQVNSICVYGNYLAIGCSPISGFGNSKVYLWDRVSASWNETIDWGEGSLYILEEISGYLVGVSVVGGSSRIGKAFIGTSGGNLPVTTFNQKVVFRAYGGAKADIIREFRSNDSTASLSVKRAKQKVNNYLYFMLAMTFPDGNLQEGLWKIGKNAETGNWSVVLDRAPNNDTNTTSGTLHGFIFVGDYLFFAYDDNGTFAVSKTNDTATYTATSIYETIILNDGDSTITKKIKGIKVTHEPLPSGASVLVRYKIDDTIDDSSSFTTILTSDTDNAISKTAVNIESSGANLPEYKELVLRIESTGGAIITGLQVKSEVIDKDLLS